MRKPELSIFKGLVYLSPYHHISSKDKFQHDVSIEYNKARAKARLPRS